MALFTLGGCGDSRPIEPYGKGLDAEEIVRRARDQRFVCEPLSWREPALYPWDRAFAGRYPSISQGHFRCKGNRLNPVLTVEQAGREPLQLLDCAGVEGHGLPLLHGESEGVYPILLDLLNDVQERTGKRVVVTCGHRCPQHNTYSDPRPFNRASKHMIGAEVDFYVEGLEEEPETVVKLLMEFYETEEPEYREFLRYHKDNTDVATPPWYNKEIFIKLYAADEGRDLDNQHPYPYIGIQVRYDRDRNERVAYAWEQAHFQYHRR